MLKRGLIYGFLFIILMSVIYAQNTSYSQYSTEPKSVNLKYVFEGEENEIEFIVYKGVKDYLFSIPRDIDSNADTIFRSDFKISAIEEPLQREMLLPLVEEIKSLSDDEEDRFRIAVSIVQSIPYGYSGQIISFFGVKLNYTRYPYEVIYDNSGICGEKSQLLAFILKEIGYDTALFYYFEENHEVIGVACPVEESFDGRGYCFIETTGRAIINDHTLVYANGVILESSPEIFPLSEGKILPKNLPEYKDAKKMDKLRNSWFVFFKDYRLNKLREKYHLSENYYLD